MKKILLSFIGLLCLTSCSEHVATEVKTDEKTEVYKKQNKYSSSPFILYKFEYEGHTYLYFKEAIMSEGYAGLTHDENCKCRKHF